MQAFADSVNAARDRGAIVIIAGNANNFISLANQVLILRDGTMSEFGEREAVRQRISEKRKQVKIGIVKGGQNDDTAAKNDDEDENVSRRAPAEASHED
jgi:ABC-type protease/lipase transport system fused ATPase/permease subunit